jgi:hypothetical protein
MDTQILGDTSEPLRLCVGFSGNYPNKLDDHESRKTPPRARASNGNSRFMPENSMATQEPSREELQEHILQFLRTRDTPPVHGLADFHAEVMKEAFPSEEGTSQRMFSKRKLFDEALDELVAEGFVERREQGRYFLTEKGRATRH